jgi:hypothetical protein
MKLSSYLMIPAAFCFSQTLAQQVLPDSTFDAELHKLQDSYRAQLDNVRSEISKQDSIHRAEKTKQAKKIEAVYIILQKGLEQRVILEVGALEATYRWGRKGIEELIQNANGLSAFASEQGTQVTVDSLTNPESYKQFAEGMRYFIGKIGDDNARKLNLVQKDNPANLVLEAVNNPLSLVTNLFTAMFFTDKRNNEAIEAYNKVYPVIELTSHVAEYLQGTQVDSSVSTAIDSLKGQATAYFETYVKLVDVNTTYKKYREDPRETEKVDSATTRYFKSLLDKNVALTGGPEDLPPPSLFAPTALSISETEPIEQSRRHILGLLKEYEVLRAEVQSSLNKRKAALVHSSSFTSTHAEPQGFLGLVERAIVKADSQIMKFTHESAYQIMPAVIAVLEGK